MDVIPVSVGCAAQAWDEQHLDLTAASRQVGAAPSGGFTGAVSGSATRFATTWERHTTAIARDAEVRADSLRRTIADYLATDGAVVEDLIRLAGYVQERR